MGTAFVWGFWFTMGAGAASFILGVGVLVIWIAILAALLGDSG